MKLAVPEDALRWAVEVIGGWKEENASVHRHYTLVLKDILNNPKRNEVRDAKTSYYPSR